MKRNCVLPLCLGALFTCVPAMSQEETQTTLQDLVRCSMDRNRRVLVLHYLVNRARGSAQQSDVRPAPSIAEGFSGTPLGNPGYQKVSAGFVQSFEAFGKRKNQVPVANFGLALAAAELDEHNARVSYESEMGHLSVVHESAQIALLDGASDSLRESTRQADERVPRGEATHLPAVERSSMDALRLTRLGETQLELVEVARALADLKRLTGGLLS